MSKQSNAFFIMTSMEYNVLYLLHVCCFFKQQSIQAFLSLYVSRHIFLNGIQLSSNVYFIL